MFCLHSILPPFISHCLSSSTFRKALRQLPACEHPSPTQASEDTAHSKISGRALVSPPGYAPEPKSSTSSGHA
eukprot:scaffold11849_cov66-Phaeocystis_antarctica.AAC.3